MGLIVEISPKLDIELRRESVRLIPHTEGDLEIDYDTVFALEAGVKEIIKSERFQRWLAKREDRHYRPEPTKPEESDLIKAIRYYVEQPHINGAVFRTHMRKLLAESK